MNKESIENFGIDSVNHPYHYTTHPSGVETIEITRELPFDLGNAWKYLMRFRYKGKPLEDLKKAVWYLKDYIEYQVKDQSTWSIEHRVQFSGKLFNPNLYNNKITSDMLKVIESESNECVRSAFTLIATCATYGNPQFLNAKLIVDDLDSIKWDILEDVRIDQANEGASEIIDKLEKEEKSEKTAQVKQ